MCQKPSTTSCTDVQNSTLSTSFLPLCREKLVDRECQERKETLAQLYVTPIITLLKHQHHPKHTNMHAKGENSHHITLCLWLNGGGTGKILCFYFCVSGKHWRSWSSWLQWNEGKVHISEILHTEMLISRGRGGVLDVDQRRPKGFSSSSTDA